jgi:ABC-type phosphate transport system auxiliary subunit
MEPRKLTQEEIDLVKDLQKQFQDVTYQIGQYQVKKYLLEKDVEAMNEQINALSLEISRLQQKDKEVAESLTEKYGTGYINIETGEITDIS